MNRWLVCNADGTPITVYNGNEPRLPDGNRLRDGDVAYRLTVERVVHMERVLTDITEDVQNG